MMDWDKLRVFHAVGEAGSFTKAGENLNLSQSAVSRQISALERDLSVPLFNRHARGLVMTEQGELLFKTVWEILDKLENTKTRLADSSEKPFGPLRVTATVGLGSVWLTPRMGEFAKLYPDVKLQLLLANEELDLQTRKADVAIRLRQPVQQGLIQRKLFTVHNHIYASPNYLKEYGIPRKLEDLNDHKILAFGPAPDYLKEINWLVTAGRTGLPPRDPIMLIDNIYGLKRAVLADIGIAMLPDYIVNDQAQLVVLLPECETPSYDTYIVYTEELRHSKRVSVFRDFLYGTSRSWSF